MKRMSKLLSLICVFALLIGILPTASAKAAQTKVTPTVAAYLKGKTTDAGNEFTLISKRKTVKCDDGGKFKYYYEYPVIQVPENAKVEKAANKALKNLVKKIVSSEQAGIVAQGEDMGPKWVYNFEISYAEAYQRGNIYCIEFLVGAGYESAAHGTTYITSANIDLTTGKLMKLTTLFKDLKAFKKAVAKNIRKQMNVIEKASVKAGFESVFYEGLTANQLKDYVKIENMLFTPFGMSIEIGQDIIAPHACGSFSFDIPFEVFEDYLKDAKAESLYEPLSYYVIELPENPSTGYTWNIDFISGDHYVEDISNVRVYKPEDMFLTGAPATRYFAFRGINPGTAEVDFVLYSPSGEEADRNPVTLIVTDALFVTAANGEG